MSLVPQYGAQHSTHQGGLTPLNTQDKQSQQIANRYYATEFHTTHASLLKAMGKLYLTQSQGYENAYQIRPILRVMENCFP